MRHKYQYATMLDKINACDRQTGNVDSVYIYIWIAIRNLLPLIAINTTLNEKEFISVALS